MDSVVCKDDFLFPVNSKVIPAYGAAGRAIKHISVEELASAISLVAGRSVGATRDMLIEETARAYGFNRIGANIAKAFNSAYDLLVTKGLLQEVGGRVKLSDSRCSAALTPSSQMSLFDGVSADGKR